MNLRRISLENGCYFFGGVFVGSCLIFLVHLIIEYGGVFLREYPVVVSFVCGLVLMYFLIRFNRFLDEG